MKKYLIFGNGFIATSYAEFLLARREDVTVIYRAKKNPGLPAKVQRRAGADAAGLLRALSGADPNYLLLTQGISFIPDNEKELRNSVESNVIAPLSVLESVWRLRQKGGLQKLEKILTFGSAAEYGERKGAWRESERDTHPRSLYGLVKHWLFEASRFYADLGLPTVHLRHFNAIGPGQNPRFVAASFCDQVARMERGEQTPVLKVGDLSQKRDFIDIRDAIAAYEIVLRKAQPGEIVNICSGEARPVSDIVKILKTLSAVPFSVGIEESLIAHKRTRDNSLVGSPVWLSKHGWKTKYSLSESVASILGHFRNAKR